MTEDVSANDGVEVETTDTTEPATEASDAGVTDVEVETENDSATEDKAPANDEVENLRKEIEALAGKLKTIRDTADKNAAVVKNLAPENLRLKAAFEHGLDKDALELITADTADGIAKQIAAIKARDEKLSAGNNQSFYLQGDGQKDSGTNDALSRKIEAQLAKINQKGF